MNTGSFRVVEQDQERVVFEVIDTFGSQRNKKWGLSDFLEDDNSYSQGD